MTHHEKGGVSAVAQRRQRLPTALRYVSDEQPGIQRVPWRKQFVYRYANGKPVADERVLTRIRRLAIPPAYRDVWICAQPDGHIQATGRDARGRKQYRYHAAYREFRERKKYDSLYEFGRALPALRRHLSRLLAIPTLSREKVIAAAVSFLDRTLIRIGNEEYARSNSSFGLTTLRTRHVRASTRQVTLDFRGKSGKKHHLVLPDARLARIVRRCQDLPGQLLFQYIDADGKPKRLRSNDVNDFLRETIGGDVSARTFRTWGASALLIRYWDEALGAQPEQAPTQRLNECIARVAAKLGNTVSVCRKSYLDPRVIEALQAGAWPWPAPATRGLATHERQLLALLRKGRSTRR